MQLADGYHAVLPGKLANVQTFLEMRAQVAPRPEPTGTNWRLERFDEPDLARYRALFHRVGDDYLWAGRLLMGASALTEYLLNPCVRAYALVSERGDDGLLDLDFRVAGECELSLFGVAPPLVGSGAGSWLMNRALAIAWSQPIERFWLHTCTLDHPKALDFYRRYGFTPYKRDIEVYDDPRLLGLTRADAAPRVPAL
jgi:GNAT superfamily N-acetyltransferase